MDPNNQTNSPNGTPVSPTTSQPLPQSTPITQTPIQSTSPRSTTNDQPLVPQAQPALQVEPASTHPDNTTSRPFPTPQLTEMHSENTADAEQTKDEQQITRPQKKSTKILLIILLLLTVIGGTLAVLISTGVINFGEGSGNSGGSGKETSNLSVPTASKIKELCETNNGEYTETVSNIEMAFRDVLPDGAKTINDHYCSNGIVVTISSENYLDLLSEIVKKNPDYESEYPIRASSMAKMYSMVFSKSKRNPDGTIEKNEYTFTPTIDEENYYKANAGTNGENDKGIFIVYKNAIVMATSDISKEYLEQLGLYK